MPQRVVILRGMGSGDVKSPCRNDMYVAENTQGEIAFRGLTRDEVVCLQHLAEGRPLTTIVFDEDRQRYTSLDGLLESAQRKLSAKNRLHAVSIALRDGIVRGLSDLG